MTTTGLSAAGAADLHRPCKSSPARAGIESLTHRFINECSDPGSDDRPMHRIGAKMGKGKPRPLDYWEAPGSQTGRWPTELEWVPPVIVALVAVGLVAAMLAL